MEDILLLKFKLHNSVVNIYCALEADLVPCEMIANKMWKINCVILHFVCKTLLLSSAVRYGALENNKLM